MTVLNFQERGGWKPGTYSVGNFGSTEPRFRPVVGTVDDTQSKPSPATYWPSADVGHRSAPQWSWASDVARPSAREVAHLRPGIDPTLGGPGCVEEHHPGGDLVEHLRRKQNHRDDATAFGTSAAQRAQTAPGTTGPGPAAYDVADSAMLTYSRGTLARANEARARVGSRLLRSIDGKESAVFCGRAKAAAVRRPTPGPDAYTLPSTIRAGGPDPRAKRAAPFATTGARSAFDAAKAATASPGPGAHRLRRWPPPPPAQAVAGTFLSSALREAPSPLVAPTGHRSSPGPGRYATHLLGTVGTPSYCKRLPHRSNDERRAALAAKQRAHAATADGLQPARAPLGYMPRPDDLVDYLAYGGTAAVGTAVGQQRLLAQMFAAQ